MHASLARGAGGVFVLSALTFTPADSRTQSTLETASWIESIILTTSDADTSGTGLDDAAPEPLDVSILRGSYSLEGTVTFPQSGPPNAAVTLSAQHQSGLVLLGALAGARIDFQFRVVENAQPPVPVTTVPVHVHAQGFAEASGDTTIRTASFSMFDLISNAGVLVHSAVSADNVGGGAPPSDSFDYDGQLDLLPGDVVSGEMLADASVGAESPPEGTSIQAGATADPVIEIADAIIPGTSAGYRDYFTVEFSPGYYALGQSPVERTTWGKIKRLYGN
jgi:hypothetical protein